uniref:Putative ovule protein n=1 Tax=Solanum chacoense TaxID=4108 RepID=A0A0V0GYI3_SOLCH
MKLLVAPNRHVPSGTLMKNSRKQGLKLLGLVVMILNPTRPLQRSTDYHLPCCVMKATKLGKSGESRETYLVHCQVDRLMCLTRMEWFNSYIIISSNLKSISMRH